MGPTILLDKSALQALAWGELEFLFKHYLVVIPPILVQEIVADLGKKGSGFTEHDVSKLARKFRGTDSLVVVHFQNARLSSLQGYEVPMDGRVLAGGGKNLRTYDGRGFTFFDSNPVQEALARWQSGVFSPADRSEAMRFRRSLDNVDLETSQRSGRKLFSPMTGKSLSEISVMVDRILLVPEPERQLGLLKIILSTKHINEAQKTGIFNRWLEKKMPLVRDFAPYAFFCLRVYMHFKAALATGLIGTRRTNLVDVEYLFYTPFCQVFSSRDNLHITLQRCLLRDDQTFVPGDDLKADLRWLSDEWSSLTDRQRQVRKLEFGSYPPDSNTSITNKVWKQYCLPWKPGSGIRTEFTDEERAKREKMMEGLFEAVEEVDRKNPSPKKELYEGCANEDGPQSDS